MKRNLIISLLTAALISVCGTSVYAADGQLSVEKVTASSDTVTVSINMDENPGVTVMLISVDFPEGFTLTNVSDGGILGSNAHSNNLKAPYKLYWNNNLASTDYTTTGTLAELTFTIDSSVENGEYPISVSYGRYSICDSDIQEVPFDITNGSVTVTNHSDSTSTVPDTQEEEKNDSTTEETEKSSDSSTVTEESDSEDKKDNTTDTEKKSDDSSEETKSSSGDSSSEKKSTATETRKTDDTDAEWINPFTDVSRADSYFDAIRFVNQRGLFVGVSETEFAPAMTMTRAMFVTVLGRLEGVDVTKYTGSSFDDAEIGQWYSAYVEWAAENEIILGYGNGKFGVNDTITIEQATVIISRYADYSGIELPLYDTKTYPDTSSVSPWAKDSMLRALGNEIYVPEDKILPQDFASRSLVAVMLYNYVTNCLG